MSELYALLAPILSWLAEHSPAILLPLIAILVPYSFDKHPPLRHVVASYFLAIALVLACIKPAEPNLNTTITKLEDICLNDKLATKENELNTTNTKLHATEKELDTAKAALKELADVKAKLATKENELNAANTQLCDKEHELNTANTKLRATEKELDTAKASLKELADALATKENELNAAKAAIPVKNALIFPPPNMPTVTASSSMDGHGCMNLVTGQGAWNSGQYDHG